MHMLPDSELIEGPSISGWIMCEDLAKSIPIYGPENGCSELPKPTKCD
jgi:hypothetical protein